MYPVHTHAAVVLCCVTHSSARVRGVSPWGEGEGEDPERNGRESDGEGIGYREVKEY